MKRPNVLLIMCDQLRADCIEALSHRDVRTPNMNRLVERGISYVNAYSSCPVCVPARYSIRTGRHACQTGFYSNTPPLVLESQPKDTQERCGSYLAKYMSDQGYRTFGIGKFHAHPYDEDLGYEVQIPTEEIWEDVKNKNWDAYASYMRETHPEYSHIEQLHGERSNMYYIPQTSPFPAELTVEAFVADRAVKQLNVRDERPYFGFISFIGPHPPFAPPIPYNRMYDPDKMPTPYRCEKEIDEMDETVCSMTTQIWAEEIANPLARNLWAHYYGEITYIDACLGKILDAIEQREDADNTLICFVSDHGDHMGDHGAWQKESFFEQSCKIPFLLSWPTKLKKNIIDESLVSLVDIFGIVSYVTGNPDFRDGINVIDCALTGREGRQMIPSLYGKPGTREFKIMVRDRRYKYIYFANGGREALFDLKEHPLEDCLCKDEQILHDLRKAALEKCKSNPQLLLALENGDFKAWEASRFSRKRIMQFDNASGVKGFTI